MYYNKLINCILDSVICVTIDEFNVINKYEFKIDTEY